MSSTGHRVVFIPLRGGSKSIPGKNICPIAGKPLAWWTIRAACDVEAVETVYVATDSAEIAGVVEGFGLPKVRVIGRSPETATDTASTESALLEFAREHSETETIILVQATSPLLESADLEAGLAHYGATGADTLLSVVRQKRFLWQTDRDGFAHAMNYDPANRPLRQSFEGHLVENGAFYIMSRAGLLEHRNRLYGRTVVYEMGEESYCEIDEPADWLQVETILRQRTGASRGSIPRIRLVALDVDGVLTDAGMYYSEAGDELKKFNTRDGLGIRLLREHGIVVGIITRERTRIVERRAAKLQLDFVHQGAIDKLAVLKEECLRRSISLGDVAYIGDDLNDLDCLKAVGYPACPADAIDEVRSCGVRVLTVNGGCGAVRALAAEILFHRN